MRRSWQRSRSVFRTILHYEPEWRLPYQTLRSTHVRPTRIHGVKCLTSSTVQDTQVRAASTSLEVGNERKPQPSRKGKSKTKNVSVLGTPKRQPVDSPISEDLAHFQSKRLLERVAACKDERELFQLLESGLKDNITPTAELFNRCMHFYVKQGNVLIVENIFDLMESSVARNKGYLETVDIRGRLKRKNRWSTGLAASSLALAAAAAGSAAGTATATATAATSAGVALTGAAAFAGAVVSAPFVAGAAVIATGAVASTVAAGLAMNVAYDPDSQFYAFYDLKDRLIREHVQTEKAKERRLKEQRRLKAISGQRDYLLEETLPLEAIRAPLVVDLLQRLLAQEDANRCPLEPPIPINPNIYTFHQLIMVYTGSGQHSAANLLYKRMKSNYPSVQPDGKIYRYLMDIATSRNDMVESLKIFQELLSHPDYHKFHHRELLATGKYLIDALVQAGKLEDVIEMYKVMESSGFPVDRFLLLNVFQAFGLLGQLDEATEVLKGVMSKTRGRELSTFAVSGILRGLLSAAKSKDNGGRVASVVLSEPSPPYNTGLRERQRNLKTWELAACISPSNVTETRREHNNSEVTREEREKLENSVERFLDFIKQHKIFLDDHDLDKLVRLRARLGNVDESLAALKDLRSYLANRRSSKISTSTLESKSVNQDSHHIAEGSDSSPRLRHRGLLELVKLMIQWGYLQETERLLADIFVNRELNYFEGWPIAMSFLVTAYSTAGDFYSASRCHDMCMVTAGLPLSLVSLREFYGTCIDHNENRAVVSSLRQYRKLNGGTLNDVVLRKCLSIFVSKNSCKEAIRVLETLHVSSLLRPQESSINRQEPIAKRKDLFGESDAEFQHLGQWLIGDTSKNMSFRIYRALFDSIMMERKYSLFIPFLSHLETSKVVIPQEIRKALLLALDGPAAA